jgi:tetratricopeptide (TPR) repeat protein
LHRDLKPGNLLVTADGTVKVTDFGLAKRLGGGVGGSGQTASGAILGTPSYMAPEQASGQGKGATPATDVYGLGATLYELLTGRPPFRAETPLETLLQVVADDPVPPSRLHPRLPRDLETICLKSLHKDPGRRYSSAAGLADDLGRFLAGEPVRARRVGSVERALKWVRRRPTPVALAAAVLVLVLVGSSGVWLLRHQRATARAREVQTDQQTRGALDRAGNLLEEGWPTHDLVKLAEARAEADRAVSLAQNGASAAVRQQAAEFGAEVGERLGRAEKTRDLLRALLDVSAPAETGTSLVDTRGLMTTMAQPSADEQYAEAFRRWGLDVDGGAEAEVVARLRGEPEPVAQEILAALDTWMVVRKWKRPEGEWQRLLRLADQVDRSERRRQLRALLVEQAPPGAEGVAGLLGPVPPWPALGEMAMGGNWRGLVEIRRQVDPRTEPVLSLVLLARALEGCGDALGAEDVLRQAVTARPGEVVLLTALGWLLEQRGPGRLGEALEYYRAVRARDPSLGMAFGRVLAKAGRAAEAEGVLSGLILQQPNNPRLYFYFGYALDSQNKWEAATAAYREAIRLQPDNPSAHFNLGIALEKAGNFEEAVTAYREAIRSKANYKAYNNLGVVFRAQRKLVEAIAAFQEAIRLQPDFSGAHYNLGIALAKQGNLEEAAAAYRKALRLQPDFSGAHNNLGTVLRKQGKLEEAVAAYREALRLQPDHPEAHNNLGNALLQQGKLEEAVATYRAALRCTPDLPRIHSNLGNALRKQGKLEEAVAACREALRLQPDYAEAHYTLGLALGEQGKPEEAIAAYRMALCLAHDFYPACHNLGNALLARGNFEEAVAVFREALRLQPDVPEAHYNLGNALLKQEKLEEAVAAYRKALYIQTDFPEAHCNLGLTLQDLGRFPEALESLRKGHELGSRRRGWRHPSADWVRRCQRLVELDRDLPAFLAGEREPSTPDEQLELAYLCGHLGKRLYMASAGFFADAFTGRPALADDLQALHRYNAACAAALAGCGRGEDKPRPDAQQRARLRRQALDWLRADLSAWTTLIQKSAPQARLEMRITLRHWRGNADLAGVRDPAALARLPEEERRAWQKLWADVEALLMPDKR